MVSSGDCGSSSEEIEIPGLPPAAQPCLAERQDVGSDIQSNQGEDQSWNMM